MEFIKHLPDTIPILDMSIVVQSTVSTVPRNAIGSQLVRVDLIMANPPPADQVLQVNRHLGVDQIVPMVAGRP
jgi:hypothetical protein